MLKYGDVVEIQNSTLSGKPVIEGKARLVKKLDKEVPDFEFWLVKFEEDHKEDPLYRRWVRKE